MVVGETGQLHDSCNSHLSLLTCSTFLYMQWVFHWYSLYVYTVHTYLRAAPPCLQSVTAQSLCSMTAAIMYVRICK